MLLHPITHFYIFRGRLYVNLCVCVFVRVGVAVEGVGGQRGGCCSYCFRPYTVLHLLHSIPLKNNDVNWIFSRCKMQVDLVSNLVFNIGREMGRGVEENLTSANGRRFLQLISAEKRVGGGGNEGKNSKKICFCNM